MALDLEQQRFDFDEEEDWWRPTAGAGSGVHLQAHSVRYAFPCGCCGHTVYHAAFPESSEDRFILNEVRYSEPSCDHCLLEFRVRYKRGPFSISIWQADDDERCVADKDIYFRIIRYSDSNESGWYDPSEIDELPF